MEHILNGEFNGNGKWTMGGLLDYNNAQAAINGGKFDTSKFVLSENPVKWNPEGITEIKWRKVTDDSSVTKIKSIAPRGTTANDFIEAGYILKRDYEMGNVATYQIQSANSSFDPILNQYIFSKTRYIINGKAYHIQGFRTIGTNMENSSWWFVEKYQRILTNLTKALKLI